VQLIDMIRMGLIRPGDIIFAGAGNQPIGVLMPDGSILNRGMIVGGKVVPPAMCYYGRRDIPTCPEDSP
jgi:hypothetical protein